jgi:hypothetical protein
LAAANFLKDAQTKAVQLVAKQARDKSQAAEKLLDKRLRKWGYKAGQLSQVLRYIRDEAPIIIHIDLAARYEKLSKDTHYRNQFETKCTRGSNDLEKRKSWEDRLFDDIYKNAAAFDRVKYGVLNAVNDPHGIASVARQYGQDYLVLKGVRLRTTFSDKDSCNSGQIASCEWYAHVLEKYNDLELRAVTEVALGERLYADSAVLETAAGGYKEVQIHGELQIANHIESVVVHPSRLGTPLEGDLRSWCSSQGIQFQCMAGFQGGTSTGDVDGTPFASTPLWRWSLPSRSNTWLRFDCFASAAIEARHKAASEEIPSFPVGSVVSIDVESMTMMVNVDGEDVGIELERCKSPEKCKAKANSVRYPHKLTPAKSGEASSLRPSSSDGTKPGVWEWCASATGKESWTAYSSDVSKVLEEAYRRKTNEVSLTIGAAVYRMDLQKMLQVNCRTSFVRMVRRQ